MKISNESMGYLTKILLVVISFIVSGGHCGPEQRDVQLIAGGEATIESPGYPTTSPEPGTSILWSVSSPEGTTITIKCPDIRISPSEGCKKGSLLVIHSGEKSSHFCGSESGLQITSNDNRMTVHFELIWAAGLVHCQVRASRSVDPPLKLVSEPEDIKKVIIMPGDKLYTAMDLRPVPTGEKIKWEFSTVSDYKIGIKCPSLWFTYSGSCNGGNATFDLGDRKEVFCQSHKNVSFVSDRNTLTVTLETVKSTVGFLVCSVLATKGPYFEPWRNLPWKQEDSSEHGLLQKKGPKQTTCNCGWANKPNRRILNGVDAGPNEFPWMAALLHKGAQICGGSIITEYHVMTAAHCTDRFLPEDVTVAVGINHLSKQERYRQIIQAASFINHDGYQLGYASKRDIGLIVLDDKIIFNEKVGPVCLPVYEPSNVYNNDVIAIGWGMMTPEEMETLDTEVLKKTKLKAINMKVCNMVYDNRYEMNPVTQLCLWAPRSGTCFGDSGGPHVWLDPDTNRYVQISLTSLGDWCKFEKPTVSTAIHYYYPWILEAIQRSNHPQEKVCTKID
uniref:Venom S1 protease with CUB domain 12 n=1 Tax=Platymeris rhadamanthus TaxID=1134088 RepID=A0A6B9L551_PLARH|nr:venom S1 protease with CUB domain 12 [Platymeris rhadamanthus]